MTYLDCQGIAVAHKTKLTPATLWKASSSMSLRRSVKQGSVWNAYSSPELAYHSCFLCCLVVSTAEPRCLFSVTAAFKSKTNLKQIFSLGVYGFPILMRTRTLRVRHLSCFHMTQGIPVNFWYVLTLEMIQEKWSLIRESYWKLLMALHSLALPHLNHHKLNISTIMCWFQSETAKN